MGRQIVLLVVVAVALHACVLGMTSVLPNSFPSGVWPGYKVHGIIAFSVSQDRHCAAGVDRCPHRFVSTVLSMRTFGIFECLIHGLFVHIVSADSGILYLGVIRTSWTRMQCRSVCTAP